MASLSAAKTVTVASRREAEPDTIIHGPGCVFQASCVATGAALLIPKLVSLKWLAYVHTSGVAALTAVQA